MGIRLVAKRLTLDKLDRQNGRYFALFYRIWQIRGQYVKVAGVKMDIPSRLSRLNGGDA